MAKNAEDFFQPELARLGYTGAFLAKPHSPAQQYGYAPDGCALFFRSSRLAAVQPPQGMRPKFIALMGNLSSSNHIHVCGHAFSPCMELWHAC